MEVLVLGGDLRYLEIIENLSSKYNVSLVGYKNIFINSKVRNIDYKDVSIGDYDIIIFPINGVMAKNMINCRFNNNSIKLDDNFLVGCKKDVLIFSGIPTEALSNMLSLANRNCTYLMHDRKVIKENAIPTVEGIIADIIVNTDKTITESNVLVFGYGNIGSVLVKYLTMLGADVSVFIINEEDKIKLDELNIKNYYTFNHDDLIREIGNNDIIVNTVPRNIINNYDIRYINRDAYVLDIASHPHGIDREVLDEFFIKNKLYLGIPGKVASKTSGKILTKKINEVMGDI